MEFNVNINSVAGSSIKNSEDAGVITRRAAELGLQTTIRIIHDGGGQLVALGDRHQPVYRDLVNTRSKSFSSFASLRGSDYLGDPTSTAQSPGKHGITVTCNNAFN